MSTPPEAGVAVGVDCKFFEGGDAVGCSSVGCEEVLGGLPRPPEVALVDKVDCEHALGCSVDGGGATSNGKGDKVFPGPSRGQQWPSSSDW